jgi:phosphohistidine swiveling domain-containing protein
MKEKYPKKFESLNGPFGLQMLAIKKLNSLVTKDLILEEFYFYKESYVTVWVYSEEIEKVRKYCLSQFDKDQNYFVDLYNKTNSGFEDFVSKESLFIEQIESLKSIDQIKKWLEGFCDYASNITPVGYLVEMFAGYDKYWVNYTGINEEDFATLVSPEKVSFTKEYEYELAKIKLGERSYKIKDLQKKWYWVRNNYFIVDIVNEEVIEKQIKDMTVDEARRIINDVDTIVSSIKPKKDEIIKRLNITRSTIGITNALSSFIILQDRRKEIALKTTSFFVRVCNKLLELYKYSDDEKKVILSSAFHQWFYELNREELLEKSYEANVGAFYRIGGPTLIGQDAIKINNEFVDSTSMENVREIKGQIAYKGNIKSRVIVVLRNEDFSKFQDGDILVTSMTRPEFVPLMKMASAFITDEGGITCHAAIVARELKKPCIIGTKIATKVLKDGDMVEVDADKGIVKII